MQNRVVFVGWNPREAADFRRSTSIPVREFCRATALRLAPAIFVLGTAALNQVTPVVARAATGHVLAARIAVAEAIDQPGGIPLERLLLWAADRSTVEIIPRARVGSRLTQLVATTLRPSLDLADWWPLAKEPVGAAALASHLTGLDAPRPGGWAAEMGCTPGELRRLCRAKFGTVARPVALAYCAAVTARMRALGVGCEAIAESLGYSDSAALRRAVASAPKRQ